MKDKVKNTIERYSMVEHGDSVVLAVSGGADSTAMLYVMNALKDEFGIKLFVCHLNHNLRGEESKRDFYFVKKISEELGLEFLGRVLEDSPPKGESTQAWARDKRYSFFKEVKSFFNADKVALAHNLGDRVENFFMRAVKGSSLDGLSGMKPVRDSFIRPFIETGREEIEVYLKENGINFVEDSTNSSNKYLRNSIRSELIPLLKDKYNSNLDESVTTTVENLSRDAEFLDLTAEKEFNRLAVTSLDEISFKRDDFLNLHEALSSRVILKALRSVAGPLVFSSNHVGFVLSVVSGDSPNGEAKLPYDVSVRREYDKIIFSSPEVKKVEPYEYEIDLSGSTLIPETGVTLKAEVLASNGLNALSGATTSEFFDFDRLVKPVKVRSLKPGDVIVPFGMKGRKKLSDVFIDMKVSKSCRVVTPVVECEDGILWAAGVKRSDLFRVTAETKKVLKISCAN